MKVLELKTILNKIDDNSEISLFIDQHDETTCITIYNICYAPEINNVFICDCIAGYQLNPPIQEINNMLESINMKSKIKVLYSIKSQ